MALADVQRLSLGKTIAVSSTSDFKTHCEFEIQHQDAGGSYLPVASWRTWLLQIQSREPYQTRIAV